MRLLCSSCDNIADINKNVRAACRRSGLALPCPHCSEDLIVTGKAPKRGRSDDQKRSQDQERGVAKRLGARRQAGSGSMPGAKGDVRKRGVMRGECKFTRASSFSLKLAELVKIENEASGGEKPAFFIEFQSQKPHKRYVVIPEWYYQTLVSAEESE